MKKRSASFKLMLAGGTCMCAVAGVSIAQNFTADAPLRMKSDYFGYSASVSARLGYSDNIDLAPDGFERDALIASAIFSGGAVVSTDRFTGLMMGDVDFSYFLDDGDFNVSQNIAGTGTATLVDNLLYFDVSGQTTRQLIGDNARFSSNINSARNQQANVHSFSLSPYLYRRGADNSSTTLRYRFSQVFVDDSNSAFGAVDPDFLNDSRSHELVAQYDTGDLLDKLRVTLTAFGNDTVQDGSGILPRFGYRHGALEAAAEYAVTSSIAVSGALGYDTIDTDAGSDELFNDEELSGVFWRAGFTARPNRRAIARIEYGRRFDDEFIDAEVAYQVTPRLNLRAGANRSFTTRARSVTARYRDNQLQVLRFVEQLREGGTLTPRSVIDEANRNSTLLSGIDAQTIGAGTVDSAFLALNGDYGRTNFTLSGFYADSDFGFREIEAFSVNADLRHRLTRRLTGYAGLNFRHSDTEATQATCEANPLVFGLEAFAPGFDPTSACAAFVATNGVTNTLSLAVGADYQLYKNVSVFGEVSHTERWSELPELEYDENAVFAGVRLDF